MLTVLRCPSGIILAACEWWLVNQMGQQDYSDNGRWVWGEQIEFSSNCPPATFRHLIDEIARVALHINPKAIGAYWVRRDKDKTRQRKHTLHAFSRHQLVRFRQTAGGGMRYATV